MMAFVPVFFFASVYAQVSLSASPNQAALYLLYFFIGFGLASQWGGRILDKRGARPAMKLGTALGAVGFALWAGKLTTLSMHDQWLYAAMAGAGIGLLLAPASTDAVNRAIDASYGEVTGITQTVRNFAASIGLAVYGTMLTHTTITKVDGTLRDKGVPDGESHGIAESVAQSVTGQADSRGTDGFGVRGRHRTGVDAGDPDGFRRGEPVGVLRDGHRPGHRLPGLAAPSGDPGDRGGGYAAPGEAGRLTVRAGRADRARVGREAGRCAATDRDGSLPAAAERLGRSRGSRSSWTGRVRGTPGGAGGSDAGTGTVSYAVTPVPPGPDPGGAGGWVRRRRPCGRSCCPPSRRRCRTWC
ncbi:hypothetical protein SCALM49S_04815 [Streptomyces californicus]